VRRRGRSPKDESALDAGFDPHMVDAPLPEWLQEEATSGIWNPKLALEEIRRRREEDE
jgi:hypothetical protein